MPLMRPPQYSGCYFESRKLKLGELAPVPDAEVEAYEAAGWVKATATKKTEEKKPDTKPTVPRKRVEK